MKELINALEQANVVGAVAVTCKQNSIANTFTYGFADREAQIPMKANTIFRLASLSKMVTATALMQLWETQQFSLDDDISNILGYTVRNPYFPDVPITCRQLLTHTSSILDYAVYDSVIADIQKRASVTLHDVLSSSGKLFSDRSFGKYPPGAAFNYSNCGSVILGSLVEILSQELFCSYCHRKIFAPLSMNSQFGAYNLPDDADVATLYQADWHSAGSTLNASLLFREAKRMHKSQPRITTLGNALYCGPAGNLYSSLPDFSRFLSAHLQGGMLKGVRILKPETVALMHSIQWTDNQHPLANTFNGNYRQKGLHFQITEDLLPGRTLIGHSGDAYGLISGAYMDKNNGTSVIFALNGGLYGEPNPFLTIEKDCTHLLFAAAHYL